MTTLEAWDIAVRYFKESDPRALSFEGQWKLSDHPSKESRSGSL